MTPGSETAPRCAECSTPFKDSESADFGVCYRCAVKNVVTRQNAGDPEVRRRLRSLGYEWPRPRATADLPGTSAERMDMAGAEIRRLEAEVVVLRRYLNNPVGVTGCGSSGCVVDPTQGGMGPNDACRCTERALRHAVQVLRQQVAHMQHELNRRP